MVGIEKVKGISVIHDIIEGTGRAACKGIQFSLIIYV